MQAAMQWQTKGFLLLTTQAGRERPLLTSAVAVVRLQRFSQQHTAQHAGACTQQARPGTAQARTAVLWLLLLLVLRRWLLVPCNAKGYTMQLSPSAQLSVHAHAQPACVARRLSHACRGAVICMQLLCHAKPPVAHHIAAAVADRVLQGTGHQGSQAVERSRAGSPAAVVPTAR